MLEVPDSLVPNFASHRYDYDIDLRLWLWATFDYCWKVPLAYWMISISSCRGLAPKIAKPKLSWLLDLLAMSCYKLPDILFESIVLVLCISFFWEKAKGVFLMVGDAKAYMFVFAWVGVACSKVWYESDLETGWCLCPVCSEESSMFDLSVMIPLNWLLSSWNISCRKLS